MPSIRLPTVLHPRHLLSLSSSASYQSQHLIRLLLPVSPHLPLSARMLQKSRYFQAQIEWLLLLVPMFATFEMTMYFESDPTSPRRSRAERLGAGDIYFSPLTQDPQSHLDVTLPHTTPAYSITSLHNLSILPFVDSRSSISISSSSNMGRGIP